MMARSALDYFNGEQQQAPEKNPAKDTAADTRDLPAGDTGRDLSRRVDRLEGELQQLRGEWNGVKPMLPKPKTPEDQAREYTDKAVRELDGKVDKLTQAVGVVHAEAKTALAGLAEVHRVPRGYFNRDVEERLAEAIPSLWETLLANLDDVKQLMAKASKEGRDPAEVLIAVAEDMRQQGALPEGEAEEIEDPEKVEQLVEFLVARADRSSQEGVRGGAGLSRGRGARRGGRGPGRGSLAFRELRPSLPRRRRPPPW